MQALVETSVHSCSVAIYILDMLYQRTNMWLLFTTLQVIFTEENASLLHLFTNACAIIGGVFTVSGIIDTFIYHGHRAIKKKMELGKHSWFAHNSTMDGIIVYFDGGEGYIYWAGYSANSIRSWAFMRE